MILTTFQSHQEKYSELINVSPDAVFHICDETIILLNSSSCKLLKAKTKSEILNRSIFDFIHPASQELLRNRINQVRAGKIVKRSEHKIICLDKNEKYVEITAAKIAEDGPLQILQFIIHDITSQKEIESALRFEKDFNSIIVNNTNALIISLDQNGKVILFNQAAEKLTGYHSSEIKGMPFWEYLIPDDERDIVMKIFHAVIQNAFPIEHEYYIKTITGEKHFIRWINSVMRNSSGVVEQVIAVGIDITDRMEAEQRARQLNVDLHRKARELQNSNIELESFVYSASHDLRSPLRTISGFSNWLLEDYYDSLDATAQDYLKRIVQGVTRMNQLIDDLLYLSNLSRREILIQDIQISDIVNNQINDLTKNCGRKIETQIQDNVIGKADKRLINLAISQLLSNAIKFTSKQTKTIIEFGQVQNGSETAFFIKDNGAGFNQKYASRLFKPFQRLHSSEQFDGAGLGLAIVERIVRKHDGRIWAESEIGKGATFFFTLEKT